MTREEAIPILHDLFNYYNDKENDSYVSFDKEDNKAIRMAIEALEQEPCEDAISRQAVIDGINEYFHDEYYQRTSIQDCRDCLIEDMIKPLSPVQPKPKTGHWEPKIDFDDTRYGYICNRCRNWVRDKSDYCPNCGAKMEESEE